MRNQSLVALILTFSSWIGNLTLTGLAFYLAFQQTGPLTSATFLTMAVCILLGNSLPIAVYLIQLWWRQTEVRAESTEADLTLREALIRGDGLLERLEELNGETAKSVLVAKQIPEKVRERLKKLELLLSNLEDGNLESALERLETLTTQDLEKVHQHFVQLEKKVDAWDKRFLNSLASISDKLDEPVDSNHERLEESITAIQNQLDKLTHSMEAISSDLKEIQVTAQAANRVEEIESSPEAILPSNEDDELESDSWAEDLLVEEEIPELDANPDVEMAEDSASVEEEEDVPVTVAKSLTQKQKNDSQFEMELESEPEAVDKDRPAELVVQAIVGISNKIYIRGDEPFLSWEKGTPLELTGIGEYRWKPEIPLEGPIEFKLILNDKIWAEGENLILKPGEVLRLKPRF